MSRAIVEIIRGLQGSGRTAAWIEFCRGLGDDQQIMIIDIAGNWQTAAARERLACLQHVAVTWVRPDQVIDAIHLIRPAAEASSDRSAVTVVIDDAEMLGFMPRQWVSLVAAAEAAGLYLVIVLPEGIETGIGFDQRSRTSQAMALASLPHASRSRGVI